MITSNNYGIVFRCHTLSPVSRVMKMSRVLLYRLLTELLFVENDGINLKKVYNQ